MGAISSLSGIARRRFGLPAALLAAGLVVQGLSLLGSEAWEAGAGATAPVALIGGGALAIAGAALLRRGRRGGGAAAALLVVAEAGLFAVAALTLSQAGRSPERAEADRRRALEQPAAAVERELALLPPLLAAQAERARQAAAGTPPFALAAELAAGLPAGPGPRLFRPSFVIWKGNERVAWDRDALPLILPASARTEAPPARLLQRGWESWHWREFHPLPLPDDPDALLEIQFPVAPAVPGPPSAVPPAAGAEPTVDLDVVTGPPPDADRWLGDLDSGLTLVRVLPLPPVGKDRELALRVTVAESPWPVREQRLTARLLLARAGIWAVAAGAGGWLFGGGLGLLLALWAARAVLVGIDLFRWFQPAFPAASLPALPSEPASMFDPAYFATPLLGGWFASTADALLTALLLGATAVAVARRVWPEPAGPPAAGAWRSLGRPLLYGALAGLVLIGLRGFALEVARNANPRLIGQSIPIASLTFWGLHLVLLLVAGTGAVLLSALALRWRRGGNWTALPAAAAGALAMAVAVPGPGAAVRAAAVLVAAAWWAAAPVWRERARVIGPPAIVLPLLVAGAWNYAVLAEAYGRAERSWLERKCEQVVQSQQEWLRFLMQDVLAEMAVADDVATPSVRPPFRGDLWENRLAFDLWRLSALPDLGLSCLVEVLDEDGYTESLFAAGFLRDLGYEVRERTEWREMEAGRLPRVLLQQETRRYPTGREVVLRGEIERGRDPGWIRLELPLRSERVATLGLQLEGVGADPGQGYRPRAEVDRPLLLVRGSDAGWLDAGGADLPSSPSGPGALSAGEGPWVRVRSGGADYLGLWCPLPPDRAREPGEGYLLALQRPGPFDVLLDLSRLLLLDLLLLSALVLPWLAARLLRHGRAGLGLGFQERFLAGYLVLGLALLLVAGAFINRLSLEQLVRESRRQTREGLTSAVAQLQGLLAEQARALAESDYIADLLANRLAGRRPLGPYAARQAIVFDEQGRLLLDETLSDLSDQEAELLLETSRGAPLVVMAEGEELYLGTVIPIELGGEEPEDGHFFYRQRATSELVAGLADVVQGEVVLRLGGEAVLASHPERVFSGRTPLMAPPAMMRPLLGRPVNPTLYPAPGSPLSFTGLAALPALTLTGVGNLTAQRLPAVLAVGFPARERDLTAQRARTALFLAGLATLVLLTAALLALLLTWKIFGPVRVLVAATRRLAAGDYAAPLPEPGRDEIGTLAGSFRRMRDELRRARDDLAAREQFLSTVLERVPVGVAVFRPDGSLAAANPAAERILPEFFGEPAAAASALGPRLLTQLEAARPDASGEDGMAGEAELRSEDGRRTLRGRVAPLALPDGRHRLLVFEDVTEFLANKRLALNAELARQVAHEIKNPLTPIQLSIQLLRQAYQDRAPGLDAIVDDTVRQVLEQVDLLRRIAGEFSLLGRPGELRREPLDLPALVRRVVADYQGGAEAHGVGPRAEIEAERVPPVLGHPESLQKVFRNLMENSIDAVGEPRKLRLRLHWRIEPDEVTLMWEDNGPGLPPALADRLFDPYFSTKSKGTGLGLAICRNLLDKMGGRIGLRNRQNGDGAVAEVTLPRADVESRPAQPPGDGSDGKR